MKAFSCGDVVPGCDARFTGVDDNDILTQVAAHAASAHVLTSVPDELVASVVSHIVSE